MNTAPVSSQITDVSANAYVFTRKYPNNEPLYGATDATADIAADAAKYGAAGWRCHRNVTTGVASILEADFSATPSGPRTWGAASFCLEFWLRVGDNTQPAGASQRRVNLQYGGFPDTDELQLYVRTSIGELSIEIYDIDGSFNPNTRVLLSGPPSVGSLVDSSGYYRLSSSTALIADNNFHHVAVIKNGTSLILTFDGVVAAQIGWTTFNLNVPWTYCWIGGLNNVAGGLPYSVASGPESGSSAEDYIDDVRIVVGDPVYTTFPFAPPAAELP